MRIVNKPRFEIGIKKAGTIYWRPTWCGSADNFHKMENGREFKFVNTWSYFVLTTIQLFWLKWIFYIQIKPEIISGEYPMKYVPFEDTHLAIMNIKDGKWTDQ
jgi:hypothetical protein